MTRQDLLDQLADDERLMFLEGPEFDTAIVGLVERFGQPRLICYDYRKVLRVLQRMGMSGEDAAEWFDFNIIGAWMGDETPCFLHRLSVRSHDRKR